MGATLVAPGGDGLAADLVAALRGAGVDASAVLTADATREEARAALREHASVRAVVHVCGDRRATVAAPLLDTGAADWDTRGERLVREALVTLQAAHDTLTDAGGGRIVVVTATAGISGAGALVPCLTAVEGVRALAKSAARQWGDRGITVNTVLVPLELIDPNAAPLVSFLSPAARGREATLLDDVASAVAWLAGPTGTHVTGASIVVDGGSVMAP